MSQWPVDQSTMLFLARPVGRDSVTVSANGQKGDCVVFVILNCQGTVTNCRRHDSVHDSLFVIPDM
ncbi:hypothetical protein J6590_035598 [Homalodisca vitripennis]|nr:hypothetical protein J6590_035598 [Homalodisca vitripennis]